MVPMARDGPIQAFFWLEWALSWPTRRRADLRILIRNIDEVAVSATTVHQGDLLTYAFPVWNMGPGDASKCFSEMKPPRRRFVRCPNLRG